MKNEITRKSVLAKALEMDFTEDEKAVISKMIASLDKKGSNGVSEKVQAERKAEYENIIAYKFKKLLHYLIYIFTSI